MRKKNSCLVVLAQVVLALLGIGFGLGGACSVLVGGGGIPAEGSDAGLIALGLVALAIAAACFYGVSQLGKGQR